MAMEILKPTAYTDTDVWTNPANAYDGAAGGEDTTYAYDTNISSDPSIVYHTFASPGQTHTARRLYIRREGAGTWDDDTWELHYSTNGGSSWTPIETGLQGVAKGNTSPVSIDTGLDLSNLQVKVVGDKVKGPDGGEPRIWDIWLEGDYEPSAYPFHRKTLKGAGPYSGRRGFDEATGHRRGFWP